MKALLIAMLALLVPAHSAGICCLGAVVPTGAADHHGASRAPHERAAGDHARQGSADRSSAAAIPRGLAAPEPSDSSPCVVALPAIGARERAPAAAAAALPGIPLEGIGPTPPAALIARAVAAAHREAFSSAPSRPLRL